MVSLRNLSCCLVGLLVISLAAGDLQAQRGRGGGRFGQGGFGGFGGFGGGGGSLALLAREDVQKELELLDDQIEEVEAAREDQQASMREAFSGFGRGGNRGDRGRGGNRGGDRGKGRDADKGKKGGGEDRLARFRELREKMEKETQEALDEILLPHQSKRLGQLVLQRSLRGGAAQVATALSTGDLADDLKVDEKQGESLQAKARTIEAKLRAQIAKLRQQAQDELLSTLSPAQQREFKDLVGKPFTFVEPERGQGRGRGGQRGGGRGRGGQRGGGRPARPNDA